MALLRVLKTAKATLSRTFYLDGVATATTGAPAVTVTRLDGTAVESGSATGPDGSNGYSYAFGGRDVVDELIATWVATVSGDVVTVTDTLQIVGDFYWSLVEGRAVDSALSNVTTYPWATITDRRIEVEDECERICGQAFVPRFCREYVDGNATDRVILTYPWVRTIRAVSVQSRPGQAFVSYTAPELAECVGSNAGVLRRPFKSMPWRPGYRNVLVEYEHGMDRPPPTIVRASKLRLKSMLLQPRAPAPDQAVPSGTVVYLTPGKDTDRTGISEVDNAYLRVPSPRPGFG